MVKVIFQQVTVFIIFKDNNRNSLYVLSQYVQVLHQSVFSINLYHSMFKFGSPNNSLVADKGLNA